MIVKQQPIHELVAGDRLEFAQTRKVAAAQCCRSLDLASHDTSTRVFQDKIDLIAVLGPEMRNGDAQLAPSGEFAQFGRHETLEQRTVALGIVLQWRTGRPAQAGEQPAIEKVMLGSLDQG